MFKKIALLTLFLVSTYSMAESQRTIRFWEGVMKEGSNRADHNEYIRNVLVPATVASKIGYLVHYVAYIPSDKVISDQAVLREIPFSEAAIPTYLNREAYDKSNQLSPEYGPLHFDDEDSFEKGVSYSSTPVVFNPNELPRISTESDKVAYDLKNYSVDASDPDWQDGDTIIWLQLRKKNISEQAYLNSIQSMFANFQDGFHDKINGHYARVDENYVLHFINVEHYSNFDPREVIDYIQEDVEGLGVENTLTTHDLILAQRLSSFAAGWKEALGMEGGAINVQFPKPGDVVGQE